MLALFSAASSPVFAQAPDATVSTPPPRAAKGGRTFIAINGGYQADDRTFTENRELEVNREQMTWSTNYAIERGAQYEGTIGGYAANGLGGAVTYSFYQDNNSSAAVAARIPHPFQFNQDRQVQGSSVSLKHREQVVHLSALYAAPIGEHFEVSVAGGPSLFIVNRDFVDNVLYDESYPYDTATFTGTTTRSVKKNQAGFHVGADASWFFTDKVGIGGLVRFSRATVKFPAAAGDDTVSADLGGVQAGLGLRLRLGRRKAEPPPAAPQQPPEPDPTRIYAPTETPSSPTDETYAVTIVATPIYVLPDATRVPLRVFEPNTRLKVMRQQGEWLRVEFQHPRYGRSEGYIETKNVRIIKPGAS